MYYVIALDLSLTGTGICVGAEGPQAGIIRTKKRGAEQLEFMREVVLTAIRQAGSQALYVFAEELPKGIKGGAMQERCELIGVIRLLCHDLRVPYVEVHPAHIKIYGSGNGGSSKDEMIANAIRRFLYPGTDNNEADAWVLWYLAKAALGETPGLPDGSTLSLPVKHTRAVAEVEL